MTVDELAREYTDRVVPLTPSGANWYAKAEAEVAYKAGYQAACERIAKLIESCIDSSMGDSACNRKLLELAEGVRSGAC